MRFSVAVADTGRYVQVRMEHPITRELIQQCMATSAALAAKLPEDQFAGFLVDVRGSRNVESTTSNYWLVKEDFSQDIIHRRSRIAVLKDAGDTSHDFVELVSFTSGYQFVLFEQEAAAIEWLESKKVPLAWVG